MSVSATEFRSALGQWPSGVAIVTTSLADTPFGMTVSAFTSVSLEPPLILVCLGRAAPTLSSIRHSRRFAVNILATGQSHLSDRFALEGNDASRFEGVALLGGTPAANPLISGCLAHLDCSLEATHAAGDHHICVGRVELALRHPGEPLLFQASRYQRLAPP